MLRPEDGVKTRRWLHTNGGSLSYKYGLLWKMALVSERLSDRVVDRAI